MDGDINVRHFSLNEKGREEFAEFARKKGYSIAVDTGDLSLIVYRKGVEVFEGVLNETGLYVFVDAETKNVFMTRGFEMGGVSLLNKMPLEKIAEEFYALPLMN